MPAAITPGLTIPTRSRTFTPDQVKQVHEALKGGQNAGYGVFPSRLSAQSAGTTLNKLLLADGAPHKYATSVFQLDSITQQNEAGETVTVEQWQGAIKPQQAKAAPPRKDNGKGKGKGK